ncbi:winged helix DNA-binding domain-containing protein [Nonomuraea longicatena]
MNELTWSQVSARRLDRQGLAGPVEGASPADAVSAMCGAHAQVLSAAELSVALRLRGADRTRVQDALRGGQSLIKTFGPRGTVHLLAARDLPVWLGALSTIPATHNRMPDGVRLTPGQHEEVVAAIRTALTGACLTTDELGAAVVEATGPWAGEKVMPAFQDLWPRWRQAVHSAAHQGALCFGPNRGRLVTYTAPPASGPVGDARARLTAAYLHAYGPATPQQFARWLGTPVTWARAAFAEVETEEVRFAGGTAWVLPGDASAPEREPRGVRLLPYFDGYTIAAQPRELLFPGRAAERALAGGQAGNYPVVLVDGVVGGVWHQRRAGRRIAVTVESFAPLSRAHLLELEEQVARVGEIMLGTPDLTLGEVSVGPHA